MKSILSSLIVLLMGIGCASNDDDGFNSVAPKLAGDGAWVAPSDEDEVKDENSYCDSYAPAYLDDYVKQVLPLEVGGGRLHLALRNVTQGNYKEGSVPSIFVENVSGYISWDTDRDTEIRIITFKCLELFPTRQLSYDSSRGFLFDDGAHRTSDLVPVSEEAVYSALFGITNNYMDDESNHAEVLFFVYHRKSNRSDGSEGEVFLGNLEINKTKIIVE